MRVAFNEGGGESQQIVLSKGESLFPSAFDLSIQLAPGGLHEMKMVVVLVSANKLWHSSSSSVNYQHVQGSKKKMSQCTCESHGIFTLILVKEASCSRTGRQESSK